jgi:hypothetical protein
MGQAYGVRRAGPSFGKFQRNNAQMSSCLPRALRETILLFEISGFARSDRKSDDFLRTLNLDTVSFRIRCKESIDT